MGNSYFQIWQKQNEKTLKVTAIQMSRRALFLPLRWCVSTWNKPRPPANSCSQRRAEQAEPHGYSWAQCISAAMPRAALSSGATSGEICHPLGEPSSLRSLQMEERGMLYPLRFLHVIFKASGNPEQGTPNTGVIILITNTLNSLLRHWFHISSLYSVVIQINRSRIYLDQVKFIRNRAADAFVSNLQSILLH